MKRLTFPLPSRSKKKLLEGYNATEREREREIKRLTFLVLPSRSKRKKTVGRIQRHRKRERERLAEGILLAPVHARVYNRWG